MTTVKFPLAALAAGLIARTMLPATPAAGPQCSLVSSGLQAPIGLVQSNVGNLIVTESGTRVPNTGRISIVAPDGTQRTLLSGLPSGISDVNSVAGPQGLFMRGRTLYVANGVGDVSLAGPFPGSDLPNPAVSSPIFSSVLAIHFSSAVEKGTAGFTLTFADQQSLAAGQSVTLSNGHGDQISIDMVVNFPDYVPKPLPALPANIGHSNPYGVVAVGDQLYVADGGRNKIWQVDIGSGSYWTLAEFSPVPNPFYPALGGPTEEAVPTGITYADGKLRVALFRGIPFAPGTSTIEEVDPLTGQHGAHISGLKTAIASLSVENRANADELVLQHASAGPFFGGPGLVLRFPAPDAPPTLVASCLTRPTSMALDRQTNTLYVAELGGQIVALQPALDRQP